MDFQHLTTVTDTRGAGRRSFVHQQVVADDIPPVVFEPMMHLLHRTHPPVGDSQGLLVVGH